MSDFLRVLEARNTRVRIEMPGVTREGWEWMMFITPGSYESGEIKIFQDDNLAVTIHKDGEIEIH